jgi:hypothetical protein
VRPFAADVSKTSFRHHSSISTCRSAPSADIRHRGSTRPDDARLARACCRRHRRPTCAQTYDDLGGTVYFCFLGASSLPRYTLSRSSFKLSCSLSVIIAVASPVAFVASSAMSWVF